MPLIPFERFCIFTVENPREVAARLIPAVAPRPFFGYARTELPLQGWVDGNDFLLLRVPHELFEPRGPKMNSFVPEVRGRIVGTANGTRMEGRMMLQPVVLIGMLVWTGALTWGLVSLVLEGLHSGLWRWSDLLFVAALLTLGTTFWLWSFSREVRKTRDVLGRVLGLEHQVAAT